MYGEPKSEIFFIFKSETFLIRYYFPVRHTVTGVPAAQGINSARSCGVRPVRMLTHSVTPTGTVMEMQMETVASSGGSKLSYAVLKSKLTIFFTFCSIRLTDVFHLHNMK